MTKLYPYIVSRTLFAVLISGIGIFEMVQGIAAHFVGRSVGGLALALLGVYSFLQPLVFQSPLSNWLSASRAAAIGPSSLRTALSIAAIGCLFVGLFLRYVLKA